MDRMSISNLVHDYHGPNTNPPSIFCFGQLPTEMQEQVALHVARRDLLAFRQVSRQLNKVSNTPFLEAYFSRREHLLTKHALEVLVAITANEHMRPHIEEVIITIPRIKAETEPRFDAWPRGVSAEKRLRQDFHNRSEIWRRWRQQGQELATSGLVVVLLGRIFRNLLDQGRNMFLRIQEQYQDCPAYGQESLWRSIGLRGHDLDCFSRPDCTIVPYSDAVSAFIEGLTASKLQPRGLHIRETPQAPGFYPIRMPNPKFVAILLQQLGRSLSRLSILELEFSSHPKPWWDMVKTSSVGPSSQCIHLSLTIDRWSEPRLHWFYLLPSVVRPKAIVLRVSQLDDCHTVCYGVSVRLLKHQRATLAHLTLLYPESYLDDEKGRLLLGWIAKEMALESFELHRENGDLVSFEGVDMVKSALSQAAQEGVAVLWQ